MDFMTGQQQHGDWLGHHLKKSFILSLPKELLLEIITNVALLESMDSYPTSLIELSLCCKYLYYLVHKDPWRLQTLWSRAFHYRFDTKAIYRRRLVHHIDWQRQLERRFRALYLCRSFALNPTHTRLLEMMDWEIIWNMLIEHDHHNIPLLLKYQVQFAAGVAFQLGRFNDREIYPVVLPILSLLVNYDFTITRFFTFQTSSSVVTPEISQFAYNSDADSLITKHTPYKYNYNHHPNSTPIRFYPAQDPIASAFHLFFTTIFAAHPNLYQAIPGCIPIPLFNLQSELFDVEFLRRYERNLFFSSLQQHTIPNIYADTGFASSQYYVSDAHQIEGDWIGYYTFQDTDENVNSMEDWFDGPMRISLRIVPLETDPVQGDTSVTPKEPARTGLFPSAHLRTCPLTRFEGTGIDNSGAFSVSGLIDDSEDGQITWEKNYTESGETWEYSGRFVWPVGLCGRWGDEEYGGPWWMWKMSNNEANVPAIATNPK
ncbi:hypothetical protein BCV72DRAFT_335718 [Rhizopus microsporus var. microsporus]|uniref:F-box domain-containing protein n=1 Tax=Rhizopus microsporus var. microsporus TaxID=86635 RepID=A0A1X0R3X6_RHIZD|nr:hypothetical protein BCV72DRAFT_335718 [Rhizopus microsporus var. microsporus]